MFELIDEKIANYCEAYTSAEPEILGRLNRETNMNVLQPRMLSGHLQGRALSLLSKLLNPQLIVEVGTYTGYSALCLAEGLAPDGKLITYEVNDELEEICKRYFAEAGLSDKIEMVIGDAKEHISNISELIDFAFIDADKPGYWQYFELLIDRMRPGGLIVADNVLWSGKVANELEELDEETRALQEFSKLVHNDPRVENALLPIRDGLMCIRVK